MATRRCLHFVFKVADRTATARFYREILGMKVGRSPPTRAVELSVLASGVET